MRIREGESTENGTYEYSNREYSGICSNIYMWFETDHPGTFPATFYEDYMEDVVTPDFHTRIAQGDIINSPCLKTNAVSCITEATVDIKRKYYVVSCTPSKHLLRGYWIYGTLPSTIYLIDGATSPYLDEPDYSEESLIAEAVNSAWARISVSKAQLLVTVGESGKTVKSITSILWRVFKILRAMKRLDVKLLRKEITFKELQNRYMEARYAIRPLIYEVNQSLAALNYDYEEAKKLDRLTFRAGKSGFVLEENEVEFTVDDTIVTVEQKTGVSYAIRSGVLTKIDAINKLNVWGVNLVLESAWELTPFSFIIDWFVNVGTTIAAWTPKSGLTALASWYTVKKTVTKEATVVGAVNTDCPLCYDNYAEISNCSMSQVTVSYQRVPDPTRSILPQFSLRLDALKLLDLAIITGKLLKMK